MDRQIFRIIGKATTLAAYVQSFLRSAEAELVSWLQDGLSCPPGSRVRNATCGSLVYWTVRCFYSPSLSPVMCVVTGSCTKWTTLARTATSHPLYSRKRLTCCS